MRWYKVMVNYIKKMWRDGIGQGDGKLHKEDVERWYREMANYIKKMWR